MRQNAADLIMMSRSRSLMGFVLFHQLSLFAWAVWVGSLAVDCCWRHARNEGPCEDQNRP